MLAKILNLEGTTEITKKEQHSINGGHKQCAPNGVCIDCGHHCAEVECCYCFDA